jgi:hypothetical protein
MTSFQGRKRTSKRTEENKRPWPSREAILPQNAMSTPFPESRTPPEATRDTPTSDLTISGNMLLLQYTSPSANYRQGSNNANYPSCCPTPP